MNRNCLICGREFWKDTNAPIDGDERYCGTCASYACDVADAVISFSKWIQGTKKNPEPKPEPKMPSRPKPRVIREGVDHG